MDCQWDTVRSSTPELADTNTSVDMMATTGMELGNKRRWEIRTLIKKARFREWLIFDFNLTHWLIAWVGAMIAFLLWHINRGKSLQILSKIHSSNYSPMVCRFVERLIRAGQPNDAAHERMRQVVEWRRTIRRMINGPSSNEIDTINLSKIVGNRAIVLKSPGYNERGVICLDYNYIFSIFMNRFDVNRIIEEYHLVLEPGWSGYCTPDLLAYTQLDVPVFVQAIEPRDIQFLKHISSNLVHVPIAANWWVDHRVFRPLPGMTRDADLIMVAAWAGFKRHERFFAALRRLRKRGIRLRTLLVGYPSGYSSSLILDLARYYTIADQIEIHERLSPEEVNQQYNRAKVNVLWSRREGCNRAIVEGMFAGVPCVLRKGFNYGDPYDHINKATGRFATESHLEDTLLWMCEHHEQFSPREWVVENMSCQRAMMILNDRIRDVALGLGERWTTDLVVKHSELDGSRYWSPDDRDRFRGDHEFLASTMISRGTP